MTLPCTYFSKRCGEKFYTKNEYDKACLLYCVNRGRKKIDEKSWGMAQFPEISFVRKMQTE